MQVKYFLTSILFIIILTYFATYHYIEDNYKTKYITNIDTIYNISYDTIYIKQKAKIKYIKDTLIITKPFLASIDTNINNKIIKIDYTYPDNVFKFNLTQQDTTIFYKIKYIDDDENNNCMILSITSGVLSGAVIYLLLGAI